MSTTRQDIVRWLEQGRKEKATHVIVVCDTFSHEDYPVNVKRGGNVREKYREYNGKNMQRVMEVYALHLPLEPQLNEVRSFHFEDPPPTPEKKRRPAKKRRASP